jgi:hypothetical protein
MLRKKGSATALPFLYLYPYYSRGNSSMGRGPIGV